ncbi:hypothetical protein [Falsigemmobacter faecalis]|nr:hypothetical protein [Falsigemmobacter faecalis]
MSKRFTLAALLTAACLMSGCMSAVGAVAANEDVQDFAIDSVADFFDL